MWNIKRAVQWAYSGVCAALAAHLSRAVALAIVDFGRGERVNVECALPKKILVCGDVLCVDWESRFLRAHALVDRLRDVSQLRGKSQKRCATGIWPMVCGT